MDLTPEDRTRTNLLVEILDELRRIAPVAAVIARDRFADHKPCAWGRVPEGGAMSFSVICAQHGTLLLPPLDLLLDQGADAFQYEP